MPALLVWPLSLMVFLFLHVVHAQQDYAVIIDAGSTGSRSFVFQFTVNPETGDRSITTISAKKVMPGLSTFGSHPEDAVSYMKPLLLDAASVIDKKDHSRTKVHIKATAGMRLIPQEEQDAIWSALIEGLAREEDIPFRIEPENFGTIDGYFEAYYAVLASNYIAGRIDGNLRRIKGKKMIGAMDMGGSSTQLIFYNGTGEDHTVSADQFW